MSAGQHIIERRTTWNYIEPWTKLVEPEQTYAECAIHLSCAPKLDRRLCSSRLQFGRRLFGAAAHLAKQRIKVQRAERLALVRFGRVGPAAPRALLCIHSRLERPAERAWCQAQAGHTWQWRLSALEAQPHNLQLCIRHAIDAHSPTALLESPPKSGGQASAAFLAGCLIQ